MPIVRAFLPDETRISQVHLRTADLDRLLGFYTGPLGLQLVERAEGEAVLAATENGPAIIVLTEDRTATPRPPEAVGLFHLAIRYATRRGLAEALSRLLQHRHAIQGASDHKVSEAIYLSDPEGNGVELYVDRPRSEWPWHDGQIAMTTEPLDLQGLLASMAGRPVPQHVSPGTDLGHIHLQVADLSVAERFYRDFLGFAVTQRSYPGALFFSAGGYHHHLAVNTWSGDRPPPANSVGLISYRMEVPEAEIIYCLRNRAPLSGYELRIGMGKNGSELLQIRDPNGTWLEVQYAAALHPAGTRPASTRKKCPPPLTKT